MRMASMNAMYQNVFIIIDKDLTNALLGERSTNYGHVYLIYLNLSCKHLTAPV